jgi:hypothetical protein
MLSDDLFTDAFLIGAACVALVVALLGALMGLLWP